MAKALESPRDPATAVEGDVVQVIEMECDESAAVGALVRQDVNADSRVEVVTDNLSQRPVLGAILRKDAPTVAIVVLRGVIDHPGVTRGKLYLSEVGTYTTTAPEANYQQVLGYSFGNGKIHLEPNALVTFKPA